MKRTLAISVALLVLSLSVSTGSAQAVNEVPACADITGDSTLSYYEVDAPGNTSGDAILSIRITTRDPLCVDGTYTVNVSPDNATFTAYTYPGSTAFTTCGANCLTFTYPYGSTVRRKDSAAPPTVYVFIQSTSAGSAVDRAPDTGAPAFLLCDFETKFHKNYDDTGSVIPPCNPPGGNYFQ